MDDYETCQRCNRFISLLGVLSSTLAGEYQAYLCADCLNAWHVYITDERTELRALNEMEEAINMLSWRTCGDGVDRTDELKALNDEKRQLMRVLFDIAAAWCTAKT